MARPPAEGRSIALSEPVYVRLRQEHHEQVKRFQQEDERDIAWIVRKCFERGFEELYGPRIKKRPLKP